MSLKNACTSATNAFTFKLHCVVVQGDLFVGIIDDTSHLTVIEFICELSLLKGLRVERTVKFLESSITNFNGFS